VVALQSQNAIVLSSTWDEALPRLRSSLLIGGGISILILFLGFADLPFSLLFPDKTISPNLIPFLSLYCLIGHSLIAFEHYFTFKKKFQLIGMMKFIKSSAIFFLALLAGISELGPFSIVYAFLGGHLVVALWLVLSGLIPFRLLWTKPVGFRDFLRDFREMMAFETSFNGILQGISHLPVVLLSAFYGEQIVAYYGIAQRVVATPIGLWSQSLAQVFYQKISEFYNRGTRFLFFVKSFFRKVIGLSIVYGVGVLLFAPFILTFIMGEEWHEAGTIARVIIPLIVVQNAAMPMSSIFTVLRTQRRMLPYYVFGFLGRIGLGLLLPYYFFDASYLQLLGAFSLFGVLYYFLYLRKIFMDIRDYEMKHLG
jgi:O-antigen/teichoic acid export membrane protein